MIQLAWQGLAGTVAADGTVNGICTGTGIGTSVEFYQDVSILVTMNKRDCCI